MAEITHLKPAREPRRIAPDLLLAQVRNTVPFVWEDPRPEALPQYLQFLLAPPSDPTPLEYFTLCLCAHHATVASFVPTDVDNHIRFKLWAPTLPLEEVRAMAEVVLESHSWDERPVSARWIVSPRSGERLSGHKGEWFSTAIAAYCALRKRDADAASRVGGAVLAELEREADIYRDFVESRDRLGLHRAATVIAHNLGDLERVFEAWGVEDEDPLKGRVQARQELLDAGILNKRGMAAENHRHFSLRKPRPLRRSVDFLLPIAPFLDEWGARLARHPGLAPEELGEIVEAMADGWKWLEGTSVAYTRALAGILEAFPGGANRLAKYIPARVDRELRAGELRKLIAVPRVRFEEAWARR